ncbi:ROK family protein [Salibacterium salarium]|nr:ROK family protein [Salibacterium salarium]
MKKYAAFDIGGSFIKYGIVKEDSSIINHDKVPTPESLEELITVISDISAKNNDCEGIAISAPGAVSDKGIIYGSSAIPYLHGPNIKELIFDKTSMPVYMENDANCAGYAEVWNGAAKGIQDALAVVIGTGIGGAIIKNGELHKGANLHGGEFGYMLLNSGKTGSNEVWSRTASTEALVRKTAEKKDIPKSTLTGEKVFEWADAGDEDCIETIEEFYHLLALGIYNLQYIYDPEIILVGGGISARKDLIDKIQEKLELIMASVDLAKVKPEIAACQFRQNANLLGAVYGFITHCDTADWSRKE